jgi:hypothetical protein
MTPLSTSLVGGALGAGIGLMCGCPDRAFKYGIVGLLAGGLVGKLAAKGATAVGAQMNIEEVRPGVRLGRAFWTNEEVQSPDWPNQFANFMSSMFKDKPGADCGCGGKFATGFQCPEGFDLVSSDHQIACAYRGQSACLAGTTDASGQFVCTSRDFDCPPGMFTRKGAPANWCFPPA